jgi:hypothetical protein
MTKILESFPTSSPSPSSPSSSYHLLFIFLTKDTNDVNEEYLLKCLACPISIIFIGIEKSLTDFPKLYKIMETQVCNDVSNMKVKLTRNMISFER